ncbi:MAG: VWA domain-containing protein [Deltaproteobacteria bacterium]|nr:VWA domain-containing protein [Deltaproteobacteria bacterium]MBK8237537.1 VWA domain-containing protein [Deltaproteobacteria bacterium]MBP7291785.1 VWA domain-containing protein [Nannocystaceae bacterium]
MRRLSLFSRTTLLAGVGLALPTLLACLEHPLKGVKYEAASEKQNAVQLTVNKDVDILFVIDNSGSMGEEQGLLAANFPAFIGVLEAEDVKANYRIGVTTTDNGNPWCGATSPEAGKLQMSSCRGRTGQFVFSGNPPADATAAACTDVCNFDEISTTDTVTEFDGIPKPRPWLENIEGKNNLAEKADVNGMSRVPTTTEAFQCFGPQGIAGCGFESHLESMYKAFLRAQKNDEEQYGFLRSNAILSIVVISDETDCSYNNAYQSIFLPASMGGNPAAFWSDPTASAPTSAVCWRAGVHCDGGGTPYDSCESVNKDVDANEGVADDKAVLHPVKRYTDFVQQLEISKQMITPGQEVLVAMIAGVPQGYETNASEISYSNALDPVEQSDFGIGAGCMYDDGDPMTPIGTARPPVREREFAEAFAVGGSRNLYSICQESFTGALDSIANTIKDQIKPACMTACVADSNVVTPELEPSCTLIQEAPDVDTGTTIESDIPRCLADGALPDGQDVCYEALVGDNLSQACVDEGWNLEFRLVRRDGVPAPGGTSVSATCQLSPNKKLDCPNLP